MLIQATVTQVACFGAGARAWPQTDVHKLDVACRKLLRQLVGFPAALEWTRPWHEILHDMHLPAARRQESAGTRLWGAEVFQRQWRLASKVACMAADR